MKYFRVFTILLCLTLSLALLSACGGKESSSNANPPSDSGNSSQDSDAPGSDAPSEVLADTAWSIEGTTYFSMQTARSR